MKIAGRSIVISAAGVFLALASVVILSLVIPDNSQAQKPALAANKLLRVSVNINTAMTQAIDRDRALITELRRQGRCWGRAISAYRLAGGRDSQGSPLRNLWLPYIALSQKQLVQQATAGTASWGRDKLRASRTQALGKQRRPNWRPGDSGGLPAPGPRPNWRPGDSGGLTIPDRPRYWSAINNGYRQSLRELSAVKLPTADSCQLLARWQDRGFRQAWELISSASGLQRPAELRKIWLDHAVRPFAGRVKVAGKIEPWVGQRGQRRLMSFILGPYKRSEGVYQRGIYLGLSQD